MADSRPGGIEKIAHLFIAGHGASALRARDNSPRPWASPVNPPAPGTSPKTGGPSIPPAQQAAAQPVNDRAAGAEAPVHDLTGEPMPLVEAAADTGSEAPADTPATSHKAEVSPELQSLLSRAKVVAVLTGHMGPLAGPTAESIAKGLAREHARVAMLYGPAEYACLHQFTSVPAAGVDGPTSGNGHNGNDHPAPRKKTVRSCDMLLLPDWVFQFDLWPAGRPVWSIVVGYGAGSEGLMAAYGALKGLISRFGRPDEVLILPFGCNEQEEAWGSERLVEMCQRFLDIVPKTLGQGRSDLRVQSSQLLPIGGGIDGVKELLESIGKVRLTVIKPPAAAEREPQESSPAPAPAEDLRNTREMPEASETVQSPTSARRHVALESHECDESADVTVLVPVEAVPRDGQEVLRAMLEHRGIGDGAYFDIWQRHGVAGTMVGSDGLIGAVNSAGDLLAFALWLCRQAQIGEIEELASITIAVRQLDEWLITASLALPVPVIWQTWQSFQIADRFGVLFTPVETSLED